MDSDEGSGTTQKASFGSFKKHVREANEDEEYEEDGYSLIELGSGWFVESSIAAFSRSPVGTCQLWYYSDGWACSEICTYWIGNAVIRRERTGDSRTLGIVVASEAGNRVNLRQKAGKGAKRIGRYYTGTQVEILETVGDWYHVKVNGLDEGYMMSDYVVIVKQE